MDTVPTLSPASSVLVVDDSEKAALLYFLVTVVDHHGSHMGDLSASVLTSYSNVELPLW